MVKNKVLGGIWVDILKKMKKENVSESIDSITKYIEMIEKENEQLKETLREYNKETEIVELTEQINKIYRYAVHIFDEEERNKYKEFQTKHYKECGRGSAELTVNGTGIGNNITIKCTKCGVVEDITNIGNW